LTTWSGYQNFCKVQGESAGHDIIREFSDRYFLVDNINRDLVN